MARTKSFNNLDLLSKIEYLVKKNLPSEVNLTTKTVTVVYLFTTTTTDPNNPFELVENNYNIEATLIGDEIKFKVLNENDSEIYNAECYLSQP